MSRNIAVIGLDFDSYSYYYWSLKYFPFIPSVPFPNNTFVVLQIRRHPELYVRIDEWFLRFLLPSSHQEMGGNKQQHAEQAGYDFSPPRGLSCLKHFCVDHRSCSIRNKEKTEEKREWERASERASRKAPLSVLALHRRPLRLSHTKSAQRDYFPFLQAETESRMKPWGKYVF